MFLLYTVVTITDNNRTLCCPIQSLIIFLIKQIRLPLWGRPVLFIAATWLPTELDSTQSC